MDSDVNLLSRPPTAGLNTQCPCNPARIIVEGKNLAPLYSQVDFPSPPPSPPALILRQGRETIAAVFLFFPSGALAPSLIAILRPGARGAGWESQHANKAVQGFFPSTVRRLYICTSSTDLHVYAHTLTRSRLLHVASGTLLMNRSEVEAFHCSLPCLRSWSP